MRATCGRACIGLVVLAAALELPARATLAQSPDTPGRAERVLVGFEPIRQPDPVSCGPACVAMVLRHYGRDESAAWAELTDPGRRLSLMSPSGLGRLLVGSGVKVAVRHGELTDLTTAIDGGRPTILLVRIGPIMWHYVVVIGYRDGGARYLLADPYGHNAWVDAAVLDRSWSFDGDLEGRPIATQPREDQGSPPGATDGPGGEGSDGASDPIREALECLGLRPHLLILPEGPPDR